MGEIKNAVVESTSIDIERGMLTAWLFLDYGGSGQGFGGYALYLPESYENHKIQGVAGHFICRCVEICGVEKWGDIVGKTLRVDCENSKISGIGHIIKNDWFYPDKDFEKVQK